MSRIWPFPPLASAHGGEVDHALLLVFAMISVLFIGWLIFFAYTVWRFRASKNPNANHAGTKSKLTFVLEVLVVVCELGLLLGISQIGRAHV